MNKTILSFSLLFIFFSSSHAQSPLVKQWDYRYGGSSDELFTCFQQTSDGGYILAGYSNSAVSGDKTQGTFGGLDYWIVKIDSLGLYQWDKVFGGTNDDQLSAIQQTADGGYILGGPSSSDAGGYKTQNSRGGSDYWVVKIDSLGNYKWDKRFGSAGMDNLTCLQQTGDGGYILGGTSSAPVGGDKTQGTFGGGDYWIVKIDAVGTKQWDKVFGGTAEDQLHSIKQTSDGGYILGGFSLSGAGGYKTQASRGGNDYWIVKTDSAGTYKWDKRFGGTGEDDLYSLQQTTDGGFILGGNSTSGVGGDKSTGNWGAQDFWMVKTDASGIKQWDKDLGGTSGEDEYGNISQTADGGYLMAGTSYSPISGDKSENNLGTEQTWVIKTNSAGSRQWDKTLATNGHEETGFGLQTRDGCYVFANYTIGGIGGYKTQSSQGFKDYWIIKFCDTTSNSVIKPVASFQSSDTLLCANDCISFTSHSTNATSWQWSFPGAIPASSTEENPGYVCYLIAGTYAVQLKASNSGGTDSITYTNYIHVKPAPPVPVITQLQDTLLCETNPLYVSYQWYADSLIINGATDTLLVITHGGNYNVKVTNSDGCIIAVGINVVGISELAAHNAISVFPNPVRDQLTVNGLRFTVGATLEIYDLLGKKVYSAELGTVNRKSETSIDVRGLAPGIYFVRIAEKKESWVGRFVKE